MVFSIYLYEGGAFRNVAYIIFYKFLFMNKIFKTLK